MEGEDEECSFCGSDLGDLEDSVVMHGKRFCSKDHAIKWKNNVIDEIYRQKKR
jgi:hypothetical protein